jgi:16S rRNA G966 N2-methylase RsmD
VTIKLDAFSGRVVYDSPRARLVLGDSRVLLRDVETESVQLVIVDPPFGKEWSSNRRAERFDVLHGDGADERDGVREILEHCVRCLAQNRHLYVFGPDDVLAGLKVSKPAELIWDKVTNGLGGTQAVWAPAHERINFAVGLHRHGGQVGKPTVPARLRKGSVLRYQRPTGRKVRHPSEKPVPLLCELIESSSRQGDLVLDPCAGSGSLGVAAILRGRRALLFESHEPYADLAADRLRGADELVDKMALM